MTKKMKLEIMIMTIFLFTFVGMGIFLIIYTHNPQPEIIITKEVCVEYDFLDDRSDNQTSTNFQREFKLAGLEEIKAHDIIKYYEGGEICDYFYDNSCEGFSYIQLYDYRWDKEKFENSFEKDYFSYKYISNFSISENENIRVNGDIVKNLRYDMEPMIINYEIAEVFFYWGSGGYCKQVEIDIDWKEEAIQPFEGKSFSPEYDGVKWIEDYCIEIKGEEYWYDLETGNIISGKFQCGGYQMEILND